MILLGAQIREDFHPGATYPGSTLGKVIGQERDFIIRDVASDDQVDQIVREWPTDATPKRILAISNADTAWDTCFLRSDFRPRTIMFLCSGPLPLRITDFCGREVLLNEDPFLGVPGALSFRQHTLAAARNFAIAA